MESKLKWRHNIWKHSSFFMWLIFIHFHPKELYNIYQFILMYVSLWMSAYLCVLCSVLCVWFDRNGMQSERRKSYEKGNVYIELCCVKIYRWNRSEMTRVWSMWISRFTLLWEDALMSELNQHVHFDIGSISRHNYSK